MMWNWLFVVILKKGGELVYGLEADFWPKLFLMLAIIYLVLVLFNMIMGKWLKVEKKKFLSYNYVNEKHKKIDRVVRITILFILMVGYFINITSDPVGAFWLLQPASILFVFIFVTESIRAFMEWKYAENKKAYIVTVSQLIFITLLFMSIIKTSFFGMFS